MLFENHIACTPLLVINVSVVFKQDCMQFLRSLVPSALKCNYSLTPLLVHARQDQLVQAHFGLSVDCRLELATFRIVKYELEHLFLTCMVIITK